MKRTIITAALAIGLVASANAEYWRSSAGEVVQNNYDECVVNSAGTWDENDLDDMLACGDARIEMREAAVGPDMINFDFDSAKLDEKSMAAINEFNLILPDNAVSLVIGHADAVGTPEYNTELGMERAQNVADELNGMVTASSAGEGELLVDTQAAERRNRRVEVGSVWEVIVRMDRPAK